MTDRQTDQATDRQDGVKAKLDLKTKKLINFIIHVCQVLGNIIVRQNLS